MIKFTPIINYTSVPKRLIYKAGDKYTMFSRETGKDLGYMYAKEMFHGKLDKQDYIYYPKKENYISLYIAGLFAKVKKQGVGQDFIKLAKRLADNPRCEKRVTVFAMNIQEEGGAVLQKPSSPFYRKMGFTSSEKGGLSDVDRVIKGQRPKHGDWYCTLPMYLPVRGGKTSKK